MGRCIVEQRQAHCSAEDEKKGPSVSSDCHGLKTPDCWILLRSDVLGRVLGTLVALATCRPNVGAQPRGSATHCHRRKSRVGSSACWAAVFLFFPDLVDCYVIPIGISDDERPH